MTGKRELAQIIVDPTGVALYYMNEPTPEIVPFTRLRRLLVNLRDPEGPCAWLVEVEANLPKNAQGDAPGDA